MIAVSLPPPSCYDLIMKRLPVLIIILSLFLSSCAGGKYLNTEPARLEDAPPGNYSLILYAGGSPLKSFAILKHEGNGYNFVPDFPRGDYRVLRGINGRRVFPMLGGLLSDFQNFQFVQVRKILDETGKKAIGYQMVPQIGIFGQAPPKLEYILKKKGKVEVRIARPMKGAEDH